MTLAQQRTGGGVPSLIPEALRVDEQVGVEGGPHQSESISRRQLRGSPLAGWVASRTKRAWREAPFPPRTSPAAASVAKGGHGKAR